MRKLPSVRRSEADAAGGALREVWVGRDTFSLAENGEGDPSSTQSFDIPVGLPLHLHSPILTILQLDSRWAGEKENYPTA